MDKRREEIVKYHFSMGQEISDVELNEILKNKKNMKAKLVYDLNDPEDRIAHLRAVKSLDMSLVLFDITRNLKKQIEQRFENIDNTNNDVFDGIDAVFDKIYDILEDNNINIDELID